MFAIALYRPLSSWNIHIQNKDGKLKLEKEEDREWDRGGEELREGEGRGRGGKKEAVGGKMRGRAMKINEKGMRKE